LAYVPLTLSWTFKTGPALLVFLAITKPLSTSQPRLNQNGFSRIIRSTWRPKYPS